MRNSTVIRLALAIQLFHLYGYSFYTHQQLANVSGINRKTLTRNKDLIIMLDFALREEMGIYV